MKKNRRIIYLSLALIVVVAFFLFFKTKYSSLKSPSKTLTSNLSKCPSNLAGLFTNSMVDIDSIFVLTPLGNVNGTSHILPVDHVYFMVKNNVGRHAVYAPADMVIDNITLHQLRWSNAPSRSEYYYEAEICRGLRIWVAGFNELSPVMKTAFDSGKKRHEEAKTNDESIVNESLYLKLSVKAGDLIGYSGGEIDKPNASIEITVMNQNLKQPGIEWSYYVDQNRKSGILCFADLYSGAIKDKLYSKFGYLTGEGNPVFVPRIKEPRCGTIYQNIIGTIQGDWFYGKPKGDENLESMGRVLAFLHLNTDPTKGVISIAGTITSRPLSSIFEPTHSGTVDREPSEVRADGGVYCYNLDNWDIKGKILVELLGNRNLKVEYQAGKCSSNENFISPFSYER